MVPPLRRYGGRMDIQGTSTKVFSGLYSSMSEASFRMLPGCCVKPLRLNLASLLRLTGLRRLCFALAVVMALGPKSTRIQNTEMRRNPERRVWTRSMKRGRCCSALSSNLTAGISGRVSGEPPLAMLASMRMTQASPYFRFGADVTSSHPQQPQLRHDNVPNWNRTKICAS